MSDRTKRYNLRDQNKVGNNEDEIQKAIEQSKEQQDKEDKAHENDINIAI
jgi:hypothetical protein